MRPDVEIVVDYNHQELERGTPWNGRLYGALGQESEWFAYKGEATNWARALLHEGSEQGYLTHMVISGIDGQTVADSLLGPGARGGMASEGGPRCEPLEARPMLTRPEREALPDSDYAVIIETETGPVERRYPIPDAYHAMKALAFLLRTYGRQWEKADDDEREDLRWEAKQVLKAVKKKFPRIYKCENDLVTKIRHQYEL